MCFSKTIGLIFDFQCPQNSLVDRFINIVRYSDQEKKWEVIKRSLARKIRNIFTENMQHSDYQEIDCSLS